MIKVETKRVERIGGGKIRGLVVEDEQFDYGNHF
jgi:hypothetical protein